MATIIGLKELREHTAEIADRVTRGESFTVVRRSKPIFRLSPVTESTTNDENDELATWTAQAIERYRPALKSLADK